VGTPQKRKGPLAELPPRLAIDTSGLIDILVTHDPELLLRLLPVRLVFETTVRLELRTCHHAQLDKLVQAGVIEEATMVDTALETFVNLVGAGGGQALGDGEAATISIAVADGIGIVIDDVKARRVASLLFLKLAMFTTVDLLRLLDNRADIAHELVSAFVREAIEVGRMHVYPEHRLWVGDMLKSKARG
jgi:predicted nucleic acid-binding protein